MTSTLRPVGLPQSGARREDRAGLLVLDKPKGVTSHDVVDRVRRRLRVKSAGHLGTLDPMATGVLLVATGAATRCAPVWQGGDKTYEATIRFGVTTASQDVTGDVLEERPVALDEAAVRAAALELTGAIEQVPPMVSAIKVQGQRLYRLARKGIEVERKPRPITVHGWEWLGFDLPEARVRIACSSGTYVRTLAHDLGQRLGCGAALASLRRTRSEPFGVEQALPLAALDTETADTVWERGGRTLEQALAHLPAVDLDDQGATGIGYGGRPRVAADERLLAALNRGPRSVVIRDPAGRVLALGELTADPAGPDFIACPHVVFPWAVREGRDA
jgi:tRNA pseudouridine55 synthase